MRSVHYSEVLRASAALAGMGSADIGTAEFALLRTFHDRRLQQAWEIHRWPDLCRVEERRFRAVWNASKAYVAGDERFDLATGKYFQALQASTNEAPTALGVTNAAYWAECSSSYSAEEWVTGKTYAVGDPVRNAADQAYYSCITGHTAGATFAGDSANWGLLTPFDRYVGFEQVEDDGTILTPIGDVLRATTENPRLTTRYGEVLFQVSENGAQFGAMSPQSVWIEFRLRRPVLAGEPFDAALTYAAGDQAYFTAGTEGLGVGDFYTANAATAAGESPLTAASKWDVVEIPYIFRGWLIQAGYADWLTSDGQGDKAMTAEGMAGAWLDLEADKLQRQSGQVRRVTWTR